MNIALVAHDARKEELVGWVKYNLWKLSEHELYATGTTGRMIQKSIDDAVAELTDERDHGVHEGTTIWSAQKEVTLHNCTGKKVNCLLSGPLGGDQAIGSMIAEGKIDFLIFFCDNLITQGHQQDVGALSRLASLYNIGFATNRTTADMLLTSSLWNNPSYRRIVPKCIEDYANRKL